jgi:hypothetical protein
MRCDLFHSKIEKYGHSRKTTFAELFARRISLFICLYSVNNCSMVLTGVSRSFEYTPKVVLGYIPQ